MPTKEFLARNGLIANNYAITPNVSFDSAGTTRVSSPSANVITVVAGNANAIVANTTIVQIARPTVLERVVKSTETALAHNTAWNGAANSTGSQAFTVEVNGSNFTIANPTAVNANTYYVIYVNYTTAHSLAWGTNIKGVSEIVPTAAIGAKDHFVFRSPNTSHLECVGYQLNAGA